MRARFAIILMFLTNTLFAGEITGVGIGYETLKEFGEYSNFKFIGACSWYKKRPFPRPPSFGVTPEVDYFYPDLVVSVFNKVEDNPWTEANFIDKASHSGVNSLVKSQYGFELGSRGTRDSFSRASSTGIRRKIVDVIGFPGTLIKIPLPILLPSDTYPYMPYYQSELDIFNTLGAAESITRPLRTTSVVTDFIGTPANHWGYMFPREMSAIISNDYKASLVFAIRAAHIVTNNNAMHVVKSTSNSCGVNCVVSNAFYDPSEEKIKWQEIYPNNRHVKIGESDTSFESIGNKDFKDGEGNYVFVIWRRYQGCVQMPGYKLFKPWTTKIFDSTVRA